MTSRCRRFRRSTAYRIPGIESKAAFQQRGLHQPGKGELAPKSIVSPAALVNLTANLDASGKLVWDVPAGEWTILRIGHTSTGVENAPAPKTGRGLECDKLSQEGIEANFNGMMAKLAGDTGIAPGPPAGHKTSPGRGLGGHAH